MDHSANDLPDPVVNQVLVLKEGGGIELAPREARAPAEMRSLFIARVCHEANRAYCVTIGDFSQPSSVFAVVAAIPNQIHSDVRRAELIRTAFNKERRPKPRLDLSSKRGKRRRL
jgi:hypothetical protein